MLSMRSIGGESIRHRNENRIFSGFPFYAAAAGAGATLRRQMQRS